MKYFEQEVCRDTSYVISYSSGAACSQQVYCITEMQGYVENLI